MCLSPANTIESGPFIWYNDVISERWFVLCDLGRKVMKNSISRCGILFCLATAVFLTGCARDLNRFGVRANVPDPTYDVRPPSADGIGEPTWRDGSIANIPIVDDDTGIGVIGDPLPPGPGDLMPIADKRWDDVIVYFAYDRSSIGSSERAKIELVAQYLGQNPTYHVVVEGHADERGSEEYNRGLSERRALAVKEYLVALGVSADRIETLAYGEEKPVAANATAESQHSRNRRAEFIIGVRR